MRVWSFLRIKLGERIDSGIQVLQGNPSLDSAVTVFAYNLGGALGFGWLSFQCVENLSLLVSINLFFQAGLMLLLYCGFVGMMMWWMPWVAGVSRQEVKSFIPRVFKLSWA